MTDAPMTPDNSLAMDEIMARSLTEAMDALDAMRADHPAPFRVPDSPDCTCPTSETS